MPSNGPQPRRQRCVLIFTKPARPGQVKTRLIGDLSAAQAARLHEAFVGDVVERMARGPFSLLLAWALDDGEALPRWTLENGEAVAGLRQRGPDLGERLFRGLAEAAEAYGAVAALGSDHPSIPVDRPRQAFEALEAGADVALGPAEDGGYYLLACAGKTLRRELFEGIAWSTERVLEQTLERCRSLRYEVALLPEGADVDRPEDLRRLASRLAGGELDCPRTRRLLEEWDLLGGPSKPAVLAASGDPS
jgi:uncharacterized protein